MIEGYWPFLISNGFFYPDAVTAKLESIAKQCHCYNNTVKNEDGSIDLFFGPTLPEGAPDSNWIQTVEGRNFLTAVRIYGTGMSFFDQTWKPDDIVKLT